MLGEHEVGAERQHADLNALPHRACHCGEGDAAAARPGMQRRHLVLQRPPALQ